MQDLSNELQSYILISELLILDGYCTHYQDINITTRSGNTVNCAILIPDREDYHSEQFTSITTHSRIPDVILESLLTLIGDIDFLY